LQNKQLQAFSQLAIDLFIFKNLGFPLPHQEISDQFNFGQTRSNIEAFLMGQ
jgi:hypothetical protein